MKILRILTIALSAALTTTSSLSAQTTADSIAVLSLDQCVSLALQNNLKGVEARNNVLAASEMRREAFTKYFPEISAMGFVFWANHDILQYNLLDLIELGIIKNGKTAGIQAMQPVFMGGQIVNGNKLAAVGEEVAQLRQQQTDNELRLTTETLYWKLATLKSTRTTLLSAVATLDTLQTQVEAAVDAGIAMPNDLLKVKIKRNSYATDLVDLDNGIQLVKMLLGQYTGLGTDGHVDICENVPDSLPLLPLDIYLSPEQALYSTVDYRLLDKNVEAKKIEKRIEIGKNLPMVAVGAGWYYHDLLDQNNNFGAVQIGVAIPLSGWWGGSHAIKRKSLELTNAENMRTNLSEQLQIGIRDKWNNLTSAHRKMAIARQEIEESDENLRLSRMYYQAGISTITDLLEAETARKQSLDHFIEAYGAYRTAVAQYLIATGR